MEKELQMMLKKRKMGSISDMYISGAISEESMIVYATAIELFKKEYKQGVKEFYELPLRTKSMSP